jgi:hypothetical protein
MKYTVVWEDSARSEVASEWVEGRYKIAIIDAVAAPDRALQSDPIGNGRPLGEGFYFIDCPPLRAVYSVDESAMRMDVGRIRRIK